MQVRIKRVKRGKYFEPNKIDDIFRKGTISKFPEIGEYLFVSFPEHGYGLGNWHTTDIRHISIKLGFLQIRTRNSVYHLKLGWGK